MMTSQTIDLALIQPNWPSVTSVQAYTTTRQGGVSLPPYDSLNLAYHVEDNPQAVSQNRQLLAQRLQQSVIVWLDQQHTTDCLYVDSVPQQISIADAVWTDQPGLVLSVMTAH